jgi:hypothetical protein
MEPEALLEVLSFFAEQAVGHALEADQRQRRHPGQAFGNQVIGMHAQLMTALARFIQAVQPAQVGNGRYRAAVRLAHDQFQTHLREADRLMQELDVPANSDCEDLADAFANYVQTYADTVSPNFRDLLNSVQAGFKDALPAISISIGILAACHVEKEARLPFLEAAVPFDEEYAVQLAPKESGA